MKNKKAFFTTKWITYTAMLTALVIATCAIPPVYIPYYNKRADDGGNTRPYGFKLFKLFRESEMQLLIPRC